MKIKFVHGKLKKKHIPGGKDCKLMPCPCSHFNVDIKFGDRLYSKEKRPGSPLLF